MLPIFLVTFSITICDALSASYASSYWAGVVEYAKFYHKNPTVERDTNLQEYLKLIYSVDTVNLDILVFPEATLNNFATAEFVKDLETEEIGDYPAGKIVQEISTAAKYRKMYIVVNLYEISRCPDAQQIRFNDTRPCPKYGLNMYNTNLVFDNNGNLVSKYRKYNLYGEAGVTQPLYPESVPFTTNFGVTFAQMICFDLLFEQPAIDLVQKGITNFIISKMWYSKAPFLTAVQIQESWAYGNNVNLLAAGASNPAQGSTGTGIYHGKFGALTAVMNFQPKRTIYKAMVPKDMKRKPFYGKIENHIPNDMLNLFLKHDNFTPFVTELLPSRSEIIQTTICMSNCCTFNIDYQFNGDEHAYKYRMIAYSGPRTLSSLPKREAVEICAVVACANDTMESCSMRMANTEPGFIFNSIKISTLLPRDHIVVMPTSSSLSITPYPVTDFRLKQSDDGYVEIDLLKEKSDLYAFGLYNRNYDRDALFNDFLVDIIV